MITSEQIRAGRALLKWSAEDLANAAGVGIATVRRLEVVNGVPSCQVRILEALKATLELAGVSFIGTPQDSPGVRLKNSNIRDETKN